MLDVHHETIKTWVANKVRRDTSTHDRTVELHQLATEPVDAAATFTELRMLLQEMCFGGLEWPAEMIVRRRGASEVLYLDYPDEPQSYLVDLLVDGEVQAPGDGFYFYSVMVFHTVGGKQLAFLLSDTLSSDLPPYITMLGCLDVKAGVEVPMELVSTTISAKSI